MSSVSGLKASPQTATVLPRRSPRQLQFVENDRLLAFVDPLHGFDHLHRVAVFVCRVGQRLHVLRKARAAVTAARIEEFAADAGVGTDSFADHLDVGAYQIAQVGDLVHERNSRRQHGVGGVFGHLGRGNVHEQHAEIVDQERPVELGHQLARPSLSMVRSDSSTPDRSTGTAACRSASTRRASGTGSDSTAGPPPFNTSR